MVGLAGKALMLRTNVLETGEIHPKELVNLRLYVPAVFT
jgi:hypothetical protein